MDSSFRVKFETPVLSELIKRNTVVDMHFHTSYSDGRNGTKKIAKRAQELGIGIAITDHNEIKGALELNKYKKILSIPGIEITTKEGPHLLIYFYDVKSLKQFFHKSIKPNMGHELMSSIHLEVEEVIKQARNYKTVIIFPHPYSAAYTGICNRQLPQVRRERLLQMVDGVEVINAENMNKWNLRSTVLGFNLNKSITAGSDGHGIAHMGRAVSVADCKKNRKAFLDAVKNKQNTVIGKEIALISKMTSNGYKIRSNMKNYPDLVEKNVRYGCALINSTSKRLRENMIQNFNLRPADGKS
jgi:predicted metal-dependent phosphoesterase TrpH